MIRVVNFSMDGVELKLASMSWAEAEKFVEEGRALLERQKIENIGEEFVKRQLETVSRSLVKAGGEFPVDKLKAEFDMPTVTAIFTKVLEISGLATTPGEVKAAA